jgi:hypothetical protein
VAQTVEEPFFALFMAKKAKKHEACQGFALCAEGTLHLPIIQLRLDR